MSKKNNNYYSNTSVYNESIRTLRTNIQFSDIDQDFKKLVITSSIPNEGKTTIAINLARSFAENGLKVLLIDCDLRNPSVSKILGYENNVGLTNLLLNKIEFVKAKIVDDKSENLDILLSGPIPPNPSEVVSSKSFKNLIEKLEEFYDYIIIDTPPVGIITDAAIISTISDGVILITKSNDTKKDVIKSAINNIETVGSKIIGVVLTFVKTKGSHYGDYYYTK